MPIIEPDLPIRRPGSHGVEGYHLQSGAGRIPRDTRTVGKRKDNAARDCWPDSTGPAPGTVYLDGQELGALNEDQRARVRGEKVGFVFQAFQLIPTLTAQENVQVPLELRGDDGSAARARELLARVGLGGREHHYPSQLSGGEQQRVALARGFSIRPKVLFADEPTGNLDAKTGATIIDLMVELNRDLGTTLVLVTHDLDLAARARRTIRLADGSVVADSAA